MTPSRRNQALTAALVAAGLTLTGCGGGAADAEPAPTATVSATPTPEPVETAPGSPGVPATGTWLVFSTEAEKGEYTIVDANRDYTAEGVEFTGTEMVEVPGGVFSSVLRAEGTGIGFTTSCQLWEDGTLTDSDVIDHPGQVMCYER